MLIQCHIINSLSVFVAIPLPICSTDKELLYSRNSLTSLLWTTITESVDICYNTFFIKACTFCTGTDHENTVASVYDYSHTWI